MNYIPLRERGSISWNKTSSNPILQLWRTYERRGHNCLCERDGGFIDKEQLHNGATIGVQRMWLLLQGVCGCCQGKVASISIFYVRASSTKMKERERRLWQFELSYAIYVSRSCPVFSPYHVYVSSMSCPCFVCPLTH